MARSLGATVIHNDWLLNLDADEVPVPELEAAIRALFAGGGTPPLQGYRIQTVMALPHYRRLHQNATPASPWSVANNYVPEESAPDE